MSAFSTHYRRTLEELDALASKFWPKELSDIEANLSVIPILLETQDQFISILKVGARDLEALSNVISSSTLPANLFVKHLVVLSDFGGEMLQRVNSEFHALFPTRRIEYLWNGKTCSHTFRALPVRALTNDKLGISGKKLLREQPLTDLHRDVIVLLLFGSVCTNENAAAVLAKCEIGNYLQRPEVLERYVRQRYIWVSRITAGSQSNTLGQIAQRFVEEFLKDHLKIEGLKITKNGTISGITHSDDPNRLTTFDLVISRGAKHAAVEVSFQVTTNSVIERKAGQARSRFEQINRAGYRIAYVIDGAGNFQRSSAVSTLCSFSHCNVAFTRSELEVLCRFLDDYFHRS